MSCELLKACQLNLTLSIPIVFETPHLHRMDRPIVVKVLIDESLLNTWNELAAERCKYLTVEHPVRSIVVKTADIHLVAISDLLGYGRHRVEIIAQPVDI